MEVKTSRTGIVFYSRSGHSKRLAERLREVLDGELQEIQAPAYSRPIWGFARAGFDSLRQRDMPGSHPLPEVAGYDRLILCGPVWTSYPATPLRTYLRAGLPLPQTVGLFLTSADHSPAQKAFDVAEKDLGRSFTAVQSLSNADEGTGKEDDAIAAFVSDLERAELMAQSN
ncbi:flavodoxin family protein [Tateyamaria armeniaca]|uniref:Flavodoxin family protein n=1 Tax=Tateyamaria armeniaca TaxID=2518930 RepID=A0ABW8UYY6_9RHOB